MINIHYKAKIDAYTSMSLTFPEDTNNCHALAAEVLEAIDSYSVFLQLSAFFRVKGNIPPEASHL
jgi:hypothetical protein